MKITFFALLFLLLVACANKHCRSRVDLMPQTVVVYKYDGSLQCDMGVTIDIDVMARDLGEIKVISQKKQTDGKMYPTVCGASTGMINSYEIKKSDLEAALKAGFMIFEPER